MNGNTLPFIYMAILIVTNLVIGLSLVGIHPRQHTQKVVISSLVISVVWQVLNWFTGFEVPLPGLYLVLLPFVIFYFKMPLLQSITAVLLGMIYHFGFVELLEHNLFDLILSYNGIKQDAVIQLMITLFVMMNNILITMFVYQKEPILIKGELFHMGNKEDDQVMTFKPHLLFNIFILLTMNIFLYYTYLEKTFFTLNFRIFVTFWSLFICGLILFFTRTMLVHKMEQTQIAMDKQHQKDMLSFFGIIRSQRHDFNYHLNSIYGLIKQQQYQECMDYIEEVVKNVQHINELLPLKHPAISAMLNTQSELAKAKGITIDFHIFDDLKDMSTSIYDMNKVLGNLIQNAMEEVEEQIEENHVIEVEIAKEREQICIKVTNPTTMQGEQLKKLFTPGYSTKTSHEGIGLAGIEKIVTNYRGIIFPEMTANTITINVRIPVLNQNNY